GQVFRRRKPRFCRVICPRPRITMRPDRAASSMSRRGRGAGGSMAERPMADAQGSTGGTATAPSGMSRGVAHALTTVLALFVGGFSLLLVLGRAQDDGGIGSHPLDFLVDFYRASGAVQVFFAVAIAWIAVFMAIVETVAACS